MVVKRSENLDVLCRVGVADAGSQQAANVTQSFFRSGLINAAGISTSTFNSSQQWDYPNSWPPMHWIMVQALTTYGGTYWDLHTLVHWLTTIKHRRLYIYLVLTVSQYPPNLQTFAEGAIHHCCMYCLLCQNLSTCARVLLHGIVKVTLVVRVLWMSWVLTWSVSRCPRDSR